MDGYAQLAEVARQMRVNIQGIMAFALPAPLDRECRFRYASQKVRWFANADVFEIEVSTSSAVVFSYGIRSPLIVDPEPVGSVGGREPYVLRSSQVSKSWLLALESLEFVAGLGLQEGEHVTVMGNGAILRFTPRGGLAENLAMLDALIRLVDGLPRDTDEADSHPLSFDTTTWPAPLQSARDIRRWVVLDDAGRSFLIEHASVTQLKQLWRAVGPHLDVINRTLDAQGESLSEDAIALQALGEAAAEARLELERRRQLFN